MSSMGENRGFWLSFRWGLGSILERRGPSSLKGKGEAAGPLGHDMEKEGRDSCGEWICGRLYLGRRAAAW